MRIPYSPTAFREIHNPTRKELEEYMQNVSSFNKMGLPLLRVILVNGQIVPALQFMELNTTLVKKTDRIPNPKETIFFQTDHHVQHSLAEKAKLKEIRSEVNRQMRAKGENPKKWETVLKMTT